MDRASQLADLHKESFQEGSWNEEQIHKSLTLATTYAWMAMALSQPVGFILCQVNPPESEILTLCVSPPWRHHSIAAKLLNHATHAQHLMGCDHVFLEVAADNHAALALYTKSGFQQTGRRRHYYTRAHHKVDALLLTLTMTSKT